MLAVLFLNRITTRRRAAYALQSIKPEKKDPEVLCRTCLSIENLVPIFDSKENSEKRSSDLRLVTGLEIKPNDGLSQKICKSCIKAMQSALQFRKTSRKAEKILLSTVNSIKMKKKHTEKSILDIKKSPQIEKEESIDYNYEFLDNDFQTDYSDVPEFKSQLVLKRRRKESKGKRVTLIPNASSYRCNYCSKEFRMKATYKAHLRFHTHYCVCESCGKRCRNNNQLQEHKRARHGLGRIHSCAYCEYTSATKEALTIHERRHTGERPYVCDHCGATFHRRSNLVQHIAIHLPEKNFQCDMCPKRLKSRKFLQIHKHNAHTGRRYGYLCPVCEHRFEKPNKVRAHMRRVHGLPEDTHSPIVRVQL
ncbi:PREDICTED: zinc finger protein 675-like [Papilio polytes]|uniref:zinc finger protein 675-like n=1 Tax=Papilio polytes TaxID=76194 RepID=UPI000675D2CA|nr:PREDICTED: zinc finger protein 675-like [Papilio polytes]